MTAIVLPATMDRASLIPLAQDMLERCEQSKPLLVNGSKVSRVGLAGLQLLVSGALAAQDKGLSFKLAEPSDELIGAASLSGLSALFGLEA